MVNIVNCSVDAFLKNIKEKKLYLFGAGRRTLHFCETLDLKQPLCGIIDNDKEKQGKSFEAYGKKIPIFCIEDFLAIIDKNDLSEIQIVITSAFYAWDIIQQLDAIPKLNDIKCYDMNLLLDYYEKYDFEFTKGDNLIPKKIHYCWFGNKEIPFRLQKCIDSWKKYCPDYEIIRWDESNYDFSKNRYMKEAYENKKWGFVPDFARLDIVYQEGGIYLDTDVELVSSMDKLLKDRAFFGADSNLMINLGQGFGAEKGNHLVRDLRDYYNDKVFLNEDGTLNTAPCYMYQHPVFCKYGFQIQNGYQKIKNIIIYPSEVSAPKGRCGIFEHFSEKTVSIHHNDFSWIEKEEYIHYEMYKKNILKRIKLENII